MAWPDTAELYWQFIGSEWEEDAEDVRLDVTFAGAAAGTPATSSPSDANLRAWGHGPLDGEVSLDTAEPGDPHVTLEAPVVRAGQFAEVRATFPIDWVPGLAPSGEPRLESVLSEEAAWAEEANAQREGARQVAFAGAAVLTVAPAIMLGVVVYLRKTRYASPKPVFDETYFRDLPSNDHPAVLSALAYSGTVQDCAFVATLTKLTDDRVIKIKHETRTEDRFLGLGEKKVEEYSIELVARECITDPIDLAAIDLYFGPGAENGDEVRFGAFQNQESAGEYMQSFKDQVLAELERRNLTNLAPDTFRYAPAALAALFVFGCIAFVIFTDGVNLPLIILGGALAIAAAVIAERTKVHSPEAVELLNRCQALERWLEDFTNLDDAVPDDLILWNKMLVAERTKVHSPEAVELLNRCQALERWLEDFTNLDDAVPDDLILWNKMLVLAVAFGVSDEVLRQLADAVPVDRRMDENGMYYYPSYWWYYSHGSLHSPMSEMHDVYQATVAELASSSDSSAGGFGGGFSGGGGGGVGGGGGGTF